MLREAQRQGLLPTDLRGLQQRLPAGGSPAERLFALLRVAGVAGPVEQQLRQLHAHATRGGTVAPHQATQQASGQATERVPARRIGPYALVKELGRGGMGAVWEAVHEGLGRTVALKLVHHQRADALEAERMTREARALERVRHPGVVEVYDTGVAGGTSYVAMRLVRGETLRARIAREGPYSPAEGALLGVALAEALEAAHQVGVVHRDVKPHNVLLEPDGRPVLTDFGLARLQDARSLTATGAVMGTPGYMPPEQVEGIQADARADVYSLGATLYEALTGRPPFQGTSIVNLINAVLNRAPEPLRRHAPAVPPGLEAVVLRCLEKEPAARFASAAEVAAALRAWPAQRGAQRPGRWPRLAAGIVLSAGGLGLAIVWGARTGTGTDASTAEVGPVGTGVDPAPQAVALADPGLAALAEGQDALRRLALDEARGCLGRAGTALEPDDPRVRWFAAHLALVEGDRERALQDLRSVVAGADAELRYRGHLMLSSLIGTERGMVEELEAAMMLQPARGDAYAWGFMRAAFHHVSVPDAQLETWKWRLLGDPDPSVLALRVRAWNLEFEQMQLPERALETLDGLLARDPHDGVALRLRGWIRQRKGEVAAARRDYVASVRELERREELPDLLLRRGEGILDAARSGQEVAQARDLILVALLLDPMQTRSGAALARVYDLSGDPGEALLHATAGLMSNPCQPELQGLVVRILDRWTPSPEQAKQARYTVSSRCRDVDGSPLALAAHAALYTAAGMCDAGVQEAASEAHKALGADPQWGPLVGRLSERVRRAAR